MLKILCSKSNTSNTEDFYHGIWPRTSMFFYNRCEISDLNIIIAFHTEDKMCENLRKIHKCQFKVDAGG